MHPLPEQRPTDHDDKFYLGNDRTQGHTSLNAARLEAGRKQYLGHHQSIPIYQNGAVIDLKRF
jgi:hypothetical protein